MLKRMSISMTAIFCLICVMAQAQGPTASPEHKLMEKDVGTWDAKIKTWMGPDFKADPTVKPTESEGVETNRMMGEFWLIGDFKGEFGGMPFEGHSVTGYDPQSKKFKGSWIDVMSVSPMVMEGTYDEKTKTMTSFSTMVGPDGKPVKGKSTVVYKDDARVMTMYELKAGTDNEWIRSMEISYKRKK